MKTLGEKAVLVKAGSLKKRQQQLQHASLICLLQKQATPVTDTQAAF